MMMGENQTYLDTLCRRLTEETGFHFYPTLPEKEAKTLKLEFEWKNERILIYCQLDLKEDIPGSLSIRLLSSLAREMYARLREEDRNQTLRMTWSQLLDKAKAQQWDEPTFEQKVIENGLPALPIGLPLLIRCHTWHEDVPIVVQNLLPSCLISWTASLEVFLFIPAKQDEDIHTLGERLVKGIHAMLAEELGILANVFVGFPTHEHLWSSYQKLMRLDELHARFYPSEPGLTAWKQGLAGIFGDISWEQIQDFKREILKVELPAELVETLEMYFRNDLNISETARALFVHRNTLLYRLDRIRELTGYSPRVFEEALLLYLALWLRRRISKER